MHIICWWCSRKLFKGITISKLSPIDDWKEVRPLSSVMSCQIRTYTIWLCAGKDTKKKAGVAQERNAATNTLKFLIAPTQFLRWNESISAPHFNELTNELSENVLPKHYCFHCIRASSTWIIWYVLARAGHFNSSIEPCGFKHTIDVLHSCRAFKARHKGSRLVSMRSKVSTDRT